MKWIVVGMLFWSALPTKSYGGDRCTAVYGNGPNLVNIATGSPGELGLLRVLAEAFNKKYSTAICWQKAGSYASLKLLKNKKVDVVMVHAPADEKNAVLEGWAKKRITIGANEFYIVGPENDPAGVAQAKSVVEAYTRIAKTQTLFLSRGDNSGTHKKERAIWKKAGIKPSGNWYIITKEFMMGSLRKANAIRGYFMTDSSTWVVGKKDLHNLKVLFKGDPMLINIYSALCRSEKTTAGKEYGYKFIDFVESNEGQLIVRSYGKDLYGEPIYKDAAYAKQFDH